MAQKRDFIADFRDMGFIYTSPTEKTIKNEIVQRFNRLRDFDVSGKLEVKLTSIYLGNSKYDNLRVKYNISFDGKNVKSGKDFNSVFLACMDIYVFLYDEYNLATRNYRFERIKLEEEL